MTPTQPLSISAAFTSLRTHAEQNRTVLVRLTLVFAIFSALLVPFDELGALGQSLRLGIGIFLSSAYAGMIAALVCLPGKEKTSPELWAAVRPVLAPLIWATLLVSIVIPLSLVLFIVPALVLTTIWVLIVPVIVVEKAGALGSLTRSQRIVRGNGWRVFGFILLLALITILLLLFGLLLALPFGSGLPGQMVQQFVLVLVAYPLILMGPAVLYNELATPEEEATATDTADDPAGSDGL
ncbi:MAG: hypothetical protein M3Y23_04495 [Actinomycetota bacterium]|nr:hypothetical protein [Actinomycetota bacterium]